MSGSTARLTENTIKRISKENRLDGRRVTLNQKTISFCESRTAYHHSETDSVVHKGDISPVARADFVSDRMLYITTLRK